MSLKPFWNLLFRRQYNLQKLIFTYKEVISPTYLRHFSPQALQIAPSRNVAATGPTKIPQSVLSKRISNIDKP
jgi:hypothetical protein